MFKCFFDVKFHLIKGTFPAYCFKLPFFVKLSIIIHTKQWCFKSVSSIHDFCIKVTLNTVQPTINRSSWVTFYSYNTTFFSRQHNPTTCTTETTGCLVPSPFRLSFCSCCLGFLWNCYSHSTSSCNGC